MIDWAEKNNKQSLNNLEVSLILQICKLSLIFCNFLPVSQKIVNMEAVTNF